MLMLVASEGVLFAAFIGAFFYLRVNDPAWPPPGDPEPKVVIPLILVAVLTTTAPLMYAARRAAGEGRLGAVRLLLTTAVVVQSGYFAYEVHDFSDQLHRFDITRDAYSSIYYTLLGADHAHVLLGVLFNLWLLGKLARGFTTYRIHATRAISLYWYAVVILTIIVNGVLLSARA
jgi:heme/copper-type cytochrome/quinol oxidase subunit 3